MAQILCYYNFQFMIMPNLVQKNGISFFLMWLLHYSVLHLFFVVNLQCAVHSQDEVRGKAVRLVWEQQCLIFSLF
jgi:hypothetical protein